MKLDIKWNKLKYNNYSGLPFKVQPLKLSSNIRIAWDFSTLFTYSARQKRKTMPSEKGFPTLTSGAFLNQKFIKQTSHE